MDMMEYLRVIPLMLFWSASAMFMLIGIKDLFPWATGLTAVGLGLGLGVIGTFLGFKYNRI